MRLLPAIVAGVLLVGLYNIKIHGQYWIDWKTMLVIVGVVTVPFAIWANRLDKRHNRK